VPAVYVHVRHRQDCSHADDPQFKRCPCPKHLYWHQDGKLFRKTARTTKWDAAYELARRVEKQLQGNGNGTQPNPSYSTTIAHAVNSYLADKRAQQLSPDTLKKLERIFKKQLLSWCEAHEVINIEKLDLTKLREWRATWKDSALSAKKKQERVVGFFHFCQSEGWVSDNPARRLSRIKVTQKPTDYFTSGEYDTLIEGTKQIRNGDRLRVLMELMRWSGLSIRDAVTLERSRLNQYDQILLYRAKTGVPVFVTLPPDVAEALRKVENPNPRYFFWTGNGNPKTAVADWQRIFRRLFKKVDLRHEDGTPKRTFPHMLRDTFAVNLLLCGVPLHDVAILLGHSSIKTTEKHYSPFVMARQEQLTEYVRQSWGEKNREVEQI
jgi:integrase/recombinase XerD